VVLLDIELQNPVLKFKHATTSWFNHRFCERCLTFPVW
jgi:hypothetical protein